MSVIDDESDVPVGVHIGNFCTSPSDCIISNGDDRVKEVSARRLRAK